MRLAPAAVLALAACSGPAPTKSPVCGSANASCTDSTDCCTGFTCIASSCVFVGGGNNGPTGGTASTSGGASGTASSSTSGGHESNGGLIGGGSSGGEAGSTGHVIGGGSSTGGHGASSSGGSSGGTLSTADLCATCTSSTSCSAGNDCVEDPDTSNGYCAPDCTTGTCPTGTACSEEVDAADPFTTDNVCYPVSGSCVPGTSGGTTTGGTSSGGTTSGGSTGGGCTETSVDSSEFESCPATACGTGLDCVSDPFFPGTYCEYPCTITANCPDPLTACFSGTCTNPICGSIDTTCAFGSSEGTCVGEQSDGGFCAPTGPLAVGATCTPGVTRCTGATDACVSGAACTTMDGVTYDCYQLCVIGTTCSNGQSCTSLDGVNGYCP